MSTKATFRFILLRAAGIAFIVFLLEAAFRMGAWEPFAKPDSNAGMAIRIKQAVGAIGPEKIDFVTVGDSRAVYGIDHERVAALAKSNGLNHINASIPGMHWMSTELMMRWLKAHALNLKGAIIATNITNFNYTGNGYYELGIATPLSTLSDASWMALHVPFEEKNLATYGSYSALFQYRDDIADLVKHPLQRLGQLRQHRQVYTGGVALYQTQKINSNICSIAKLSIKPCAAEPASATNLTVVAQCKSLVVQADSQLDYREFDNAAKWPHLAELKKIRQSQLRSLGLSKPPLVVLMPVPRVWRDELLPKGSEDFALSILRPLAAQGVIELLDYTRFFDAPEGAECNAFWDLYHQNADGQQKLTDALLPVIQHKLYAHINVGQH